MIQATLNEPVPLQILASDGRTGLYAQVRLFDATGTQVTSMLLPHINGGLYGNSWTPTSEGYYSAVYEFFFDSALTVSAAYDKQGELIEVTATKTNILRLLGLHYDNSVMDQQVYNADQNLTSARLRCYDTKDNALAASSVGLLFVYQITAEYSGELVTNYRMTRVS